MTETMSEPVAAGAVRLERRNDGVGILWLDVPGQRVNTLSPAMFDEFAARLNEVLRDRTVRGIVIASAKPDGFIAGADLHVLEEIDGATEAAQLSQRGNELLLRLDRAPKPVVAAVHGAALGGGLEVALACDHIVASDDPSTVLGLPEVMLGLLPGAGGTQRLPRRVGLIAALPLLLTGKKVRARKAKRLGLVDTVTSPGGIADTAARLALQLAQSGTKTRRRSWLRRLTELGPGRRLVLKRAREEVQRKSRGLYPAPLAILDCVETGLSQGLEAGLARESKEFGALVVSPQASSLIRLFHWQNELKKDEDDAAPLPVQRLGVLGAGFMGAGIASVSVGSGPVVVRDLTDDSLSSAARTVADGLKKQRRSGALTAIEADRRWHRLQLTTDVAAIRGCDMVIEAVFEDLELKRKVLAEAEAELAADAVFATNTSALPIADIAKEAKHPERVLGMHYFSPVPKMPLLELVAAKQTAPWAIATARAVGIAQGKTVIVVGDGPGFYTTRILAPFLNEAVVLVEEGARIEDVDRALRDFGYPVGPLALIDEIGLDVGAHVARDLGAKFAERGTAPSDALPKLFAAGYAGRKNQQGFYRYPPPGKKARKEPNDSVYAHTGGAPRRHFAREDVQDRLALLMVNEAVRCLEEGILRCPRDGDIGAVMGLGFPPLLGGPFRYLDQRGAGAVRDRLEQLAQAHGTRFTPANLLVEHANEQRAFYPS
ncbi:MAG: 3-hydroxyacyl-CoA dehydrogenase NAD-binding domain-containing protein [Planctomycetota bacterium]